MFRIFTAAVLGLFMVCGAAFAQDALSAEEKAFLERIEALRGSLQPKTGVVRLPAAKASLDMGKDYYFLDAGEAKKVLVEGWGNPPDAADGVLGMIFAAGTDFTMADAWGAVLTYDGSGYVSDDDAATADYDALLAEMRKGEAEHNRMLEREGYPTSVLIGWAQPPAYDAEHHSLVWAREIRFADQTDNTVNYDVRRLGRHGVLSINMVSSMSQLAAVRPAAEAVARIAEFDAGAQYADYREGDKTAGYGLAGLVAAGAGLAAAKKVGILAAAGLFLKKGLVFIIAGLGAAGAWLRRIFRREKSPKVEDKGADIVS